MFEQKCEFVKCLECLKSTSQFKTLVVFNDKRFANWNDVDVEAQSHAR